VKVHRPVQRNLVVKNGESRIQEEEDDDAKSGQLSRLVLACTCFFNPTSQVFFCCRLMGVVALPCFWQLFALTASFSLLPPLCCQVSFLPASLNFKLISCTYKVCILSSKNCTAMLCLQCWRSSLYTANPNTSLDSPPHFHF
jgi:hypothetical protein